MKKALCLAAVALMFSTMAIGVSAVVNSDGTPVKAESGMMAITAIAPDEGTPGSIEPAAPTGSEATVAKDAELYATQNEAKTVDRDTAVTNDGTGAATTGLVATDEQIPEGEVRYYTTGAPESAQQGNHTLLYVLSIAGAVLIVGIPITMKLLKKAE